MTTRIPRRYLPRVCLEYSHEEAFWICHVKGLSVVYTRIPSFEFTIDMVRSNSCLVISLTKYPSIDIFRPLLLTPSVDPGTQVPGVIDINYIAELESWGHVPGGVRIDVIEETVPKPGCVNGLLVDANPIGITDIGTICSN